jgi:hypothetical protein
VVKESFGAWIYNVNGLEKENDGFLCPYGKVSAFSKQWFYILTGGNP